MHKSFFNARANTLKRFNQNVVCVNEGIEKKFSICGAMLFYLSKNLRGEPRGREPTFIPTSPLQRRVNGDHACFSRPSPMLRLSFVVTAKNTIFKRTVFFLPCKKYVVNTYYLSEIIEYLFFCDFFVIFFITIFLIILICYTYFSKIGLFFFHIKFFFSHNAFT